MLGLTAAAADAAIHKKIAWIRYSKFVSTAKTKKLKKLYSIIYGKYRKFKNPKIYILEKMLVLSIICIKCKSEDEKIFKEEEWIEILKIIALIKNI